MRIRSIQISNLGSYAGDHQLDFEAEPLASAGIVPIVGPTGVGKSTLLDAITLAFFDEVTRLPANGAPVLDESGLAASDPRTLLRSDAGEGGVTVDFDGVDGRHYRARWSVHRARKKVGSKVQKARWSLVDVATDRCIAKNGKREVRAAVEERVGFSVEELRRSVLLPQGRFAELLRAKPDERAELLEKLTGTELYSRISQLAFEKKKEHERILGEHEQRVALLEGDLETKTLDPLRQETVEATLTSLRGRREAKTTQLAWLVRDAELEAKLSAARASVEAARQTFREGAGWQGRLKQAEQAEPAREPLHRLKEAKARLRELHTARVTHEEALDELATNLSAARVDATRREAVSQGIHAAEARVRSELEEARRVDANLDRAQSELASLERVRLEEDQRVQASAKSLDALCAKLDKERPELAQLKAWLEGHASDAPLSEGWPELEKHYDEASRLRQRLEELEGKLRELAKERARAQATQEETAADLSGLEAQHHVAKESVEATRRAIGELDPEGCGRTQKAIEAEVGCLREAQVVLGTWEQVQAEQTEAAERAAALEGRVAGLARRGGELETAHLTAERERDSLRTRLGRAEREASVEEHRAQLVEGEPCLVCGSKEHPYAAGGSPASRAGALRDEVQLSEVEAKRAYEALTQVRYQADEDRKALARTRAALDACSHTKQRVCETIAALPKELRGATPESMKVALDQQGRRLDARREDGEARQTRIAELRREEEARREQMEHVELELETVRSDHASVREESTRLEERERHLHAEHSNAQRAGSQVAEARDGWP